MRLSIVTTMYKSSPHLREFHARATEAARAHVSEYEIIFVNDGSPDNALEIVLQLQSSDPHVRVVDLSRNFGHHQAMWTGLEYATGDWIFLIDCDLEEDPAWLMLFADYRDRTQSDVVFGVQDTRTGQWIERVGGQLYYKMFNLLSDTPIPENLLTVRLMSRRYVDALLRHDEATLHIAGLWARTGFVQSPLLVKKQTRRSTTYSLSRRFAMFVNTLTSSSNQPLVFVFYLGVALLALSGVVACGLIVTRYFCPDMPLGWPSLMVSICLLAGLVIFCQGIQGIYLAKVYLETKRRPISIVRQVFEPPAILSVVSPSRIAQ